MQLFYDPELSDGPHQLRDTEAQHAARVLRKRVGDVLDLVDGRGGWYTATITEINKRNCLIDAHLLQREPARASHRTTLLVAPTKNIDRFEWILEKATEIGIDRIQPIITEHSERSRIRPDRLERVLESAMKQSLRAWLPELAPLQSFEDAIKVDALGQKLIAYLGDEDAPLLSKTYSLGGNVTIAVGPEGGFSAAEAYSASELGYTTVSLGPHRLRTETAAITAIHTIELINW